MQQTDIPPRHQSPNPVPQPDDCLIPSHEHLLTVPNTSSLALGAFPLLNFPPPISRGHHAYSSSTLIATMSKTHSLPPDTTSIRAPRFDTRPWQIRGSVSNRVLERIKHDKWIYSSAFRECRFPSPALTLGGSLVGVDVLSFELRFILVMCCINLLLREDKDL